MSSVFTTNVNLEEPALGDYVNSWNTPVNSNFTVIDDVFGGQSPQVFSNANITLTVAQAAYFQFVCSGALTGNVELILPATIGGRRVVTNNCSGAFTLKLLNGSSDPGGGVLCPQGANTPVLLTQGHAYLDLSTSAVLGPTTSTSGHVATWNNATGTLLADGGLGLPGSAIVGTTDTQTLSSKTLTAPQINNGLANTPTAGDSSTKVATTAFVGAAVASLSTPWAITGGLPTSITGNSTTASIAVSASVCTDSTFAAVINYVGGTFSVSNGNAINGCADGTTLGNSKTYHVYLCQGTSGRGLYASQTAPASFSPSSAPSGYQTYARRLFSFTTTGSGAPIPYIATETMGGALHAYLTTQVLDISEPNLLNARTLYTMTVPGGGLSVRWEGRWACGASAISVILFSPQETDLAPAGGVTTAPSQDGQGAGTGVSTSNSREIWTNTSGQLAGRSDSNSGGTLYANTTGFTDSRRV